MSWPHDLAGIIGIGASFGFRTVPPQDEIAAIWGEMGRRGYTNGGEHADSGPGASILGGSPQQPPVAVVNNVEQPADLSAQANVPEAPANPPRAIAGLATGAASVPVPAPPAQAQPQPSSEPLSIADLIEPKKVKTVSVRPDGTLLPNDAPPQVTGRRPVPPRAQRRPEGRNAKIGGAWRRLWDSLCRCERQAPLANLRCQGKPGELRARVNPAAGGAHVTGEFLGTARGPRDGARGA
jgi:hypothetical protein